MMAKVNRDINVILVVSIITIRLITVIHINHLWPFISEKHLLFTKSLKNYSYWILRMRVKMMEGMPNITIH